MELARMRMCSKILCSAVVVAGLAGRAALAGPPGFAFLEIPTGARASALGGAYTSLALGVDAAFWNPAALEGVTGVQLMAGHYELFQTLRHDHFAVAGRLLGGGLSGSIRALYTEPIEERDELGNLIGSFGSHDLEFGLGYGRSAGSGVSVGASAQVLRERISNSAATTYGFGLGAAWEPPRSRGLRLAMSCQNLGPAAHYMIDGIRGAPVPLPTAVQAGVSYGRDVAFNLAVRGALEGRLTRGRGGIAMLGAEVASPAGAALRFGVRANDDASTVSFGAGYAVRALHLDYAYVPLRLDLGDTHRFSFSTRF
jgi:hypothetical protein